MRIVCDITMDETVEANFRLAEMVGTVRKMLWTGLLLSPTIFIFSLLILPRSAYGLILGMAATAGFVVYHLSSYRRMCRKQIRKMLVKSMGTDQPVESVFELRDDRITVSRMGQEFSTGWDGVVRIADADDALEMILEPAVIIRLPKRMFADVTEMSSWRAFMEARAGGGSPVSPA